MDLILRPMTDTERVYSYTQSHQLMMQTGCIGHLRGDFGSTGEQFFTTWNDHREDIKSEDFKAEFDGVINALRTDPRYGGILAGRKAMRSYCARNSGSSFHNDRNEYGFRADTDHYSYFLRLTPNKGDYNVYCYCYLRQWLGRHMARAEHGIRFITPDYKERFRIADGDQVRIITKGGECRDMTCRYVDDHHFIASSARGDNLYHISEFAERQEASGCQSIVPLRKSLPDRCFSFLETSGEVIVIEKGCKGYAPTGKYAENETPQECVDSLNQAMGVTKAQAAAMKVGSMFGFEVPGADPANYDEQGVPIRPGRKQERGDAR